MLLLGGLQATGGAARAFYTRGTPDEMTGSRKQGVRRSASTCEGASHTYGQNFSNPSHDLQMGQTSDERRCFQLKFQDPVAIQDSKLRNNRLSRESSLAYFPRRLEFPESGRYICREIYLDPLPPGSIIYTIGLRQRIHDRNRVGTRCRG